MSDIFISYAHEDRDRIEPLVTRLEAEGWSVWWDRELIPGDSYEQAIDAAISSARVVVVAWSRAALASDWVHNEALDGLERGILVPVMLETVRMPVAFRQMQVARLQNWPREFDVDELESLFAGIRDVLSTAAAGPTQGSGEMDRLTELAELQRLRVAGDTEHATRIAAGLATRYPGDAEIDSIWLEFSSLYGLVSEPPGAEVAVQPYEDPTAEWRVIGNTPLETRIANGLQRFHVTLDGFDPVEFADAVPGLAERPDVVETLGAEVPRRIQLQPVNPARGDMVFVPGGDVVLFITAGGVPPKRQVADFFIDRFPVTNAEFKEFVDSGGYDDPSLWEEADFAAVKERCVDSTSRPGPAQWRFGNFPEGEEDYPVTGVSWYEACAYARFRGGQIPTAAQWNRASREFQEILCAFSGAVVEQSNFGNSLQPVHASTAIGAHGLRDVAGNAREWVRNAMRDDRATLGASHRDQRYMFIYNVPLDPWSRDDVTGFRTIVCAGDDSDLDRPIGTFGTPRDLEPVGDDVFEIMTTQFAYNRQTPQVTSSEFNTGEQRTRLERVVLHYPDGSELTLFVQQLRDGARRPPVVVFPGQSDFNAHRSSNPSDGLEMFKMLVESGRALVQPVYHGSNERYAGVMQMSSDEQKIYYRDAQPIWRKEIGQALDYLATRNDMIDEEAAFMGASYGVAYPLPAAIMEERFRAYVLLHAGLVPWGKDLQAPIADMKNFVPRLTRPALLMSGRFDSVFPLVSQEALYERLGSAPENKTWIQNDTGHGHLTDDDMLAVVNWLDALD